VDCRLGIAYVLRALKVIILCIVGMGLGIGVKLHNLWELTKVDNKFKTIIQFRIYNTLILSQ
jgi:hypothetical protein